MKKDSIVCHPDRETIQLIVINRGDRPVQIGSHVHFYEVNAQLEFDRNKAYGHRLHIPAGTAVRFEPGEEKPVELTSFGGNRKIQGFNNLTNGPLDQPADEAKLKTFIERFGAPAANNEGDPS